MGAFLGPPFSSHTSQIQISQLANLSKKTVSSVGQKDVNSSDSGRDLMLKTTIGMMNNMSTMCPTKQQTTKSFSFRPRSITLLKRISGNGISIAKLAIL